ncbi:MAG: phosphatase PAP2 family protein [archaeon]|nr:phosphatase PAP2 family protein [archaeon]
MKKENFFVKHKWTILISFIIVLIALSLSGILKKIDLLINQKIILLYAPLFDNIMFSFINLTNPINAIILTIIILVSLILLKRYNYFIIFCIGLGISFFAEYLIKPIIQRARPENALISLTDYSFPSGHAVISAFIFTFLIYTFKRDIKNIILKNIFIIFCIFAFLFIGFSRIYTNVHWFSDVISGFVFGIFSLFLSIELIKLYKSLNNHR